MFGRKTSNKLSGMYVYFNLFVLSIKDLNIMLATWLQNNAILSRLIGAAFSCCCIIGIVIESVKVHSR